MNFQNEIVIWIATGMFVSAAGLGHCLRAGAGRSQLVAQ
jgi:hypothetical protein